MQLSPKNPLLILVFRLLLVACLQSVVACTQDSQTQKLNRVAAPIAALNDPREIQQPWTTIISKSIVDLQEFKVLLKRDVIPPIDEPTYLSIEEALQNYFHLEPVIALEHNGEAKAYPLSVLMWHEIVNDEVGGLPVTVTYCPLCNAALVFDRRLEYKGKKYLLDFGVSGMLRNSDMVMWDRQTESWWQQLEGKGLVGKLAGAEIEQVYAPIISLQDFERRWPEGKVLSSETGHDREYGTNPYEDYDSPDQTEKPFMFDGEIDARLRATERVVDFCQGDECVIYPWSVVAEQEVVHDEPFGKPIVLFYEPGAVTVVGDRQIKNARNIGSITVFIPQIDSQRLRFRKTPRGFEDQTGSTWDLMGRCLEGEHAGKQLPPIITSSHFAFAWLAFNPDSKVYKP